MLQGEVSKNSQKLIVAVYSIKTVDSQQAKFSGSNPRLLSCKGVQKVRDLTFSLASDRPKAIRKHSKLTCQTDKSSIFLRKPATNLKKMIV